MLKAPPRRRVGLLCKLQTMKDFLLPEDIAVELENAIGEDQISDVFYAIGIDEAPTAENLVLAYAAHPQEVETLLGDLECASGESFVNKLKKALTRVKEVALVADAVVNKPKDTESPITTETTPVARPMIPPILKYGLIAVAVMVGIFLVLKFQKKK